MVRGRVWVRLAAPLLLAAACGGGGGGSSCDSPLSVAGSWSGSVTDDQAGGGSLAIGFTQAGCSLGGSWQATFSDPTLSGSGSLTGSASRTGLSFTLLSPAPGTCGYQAEGSPSGANEIAGSYATVGTSCARNGTFDILRQVTPTAVPTATATATATPTPTP